MDIVVDEVALLEDALRDAVRRRQTAGSSALDGLEPAVGQKFESAVTTYGVQLKAWIDWQVDAYLRDVMPGLLDDELGAARHDCIVAVELAERVETETRVVAEAQAKLLAVVEGISEELARLKSAVASCQAEAQYQLSSIAAVSHCVAAGEEALIQVQALRDSVEELRRSHCSLEQQEKASGERLDTLTRDLRAELAEEVQVGMQRSAEMKSQIRELIAEDRRQTVETIERDLAPLLACVDQETRIEARIEAFRSELTTQLDQQLETAISAKRLDSRLETLQVEIEERVAQHVERRVKAERQESGQATKTQIEEAWARTSQEFASLQERMMKELRAETASWSRNEAAISALDEQLWITDQRLGQRIDELAHLQLRERVALAERQATMGAAGKRAGMASADAPPSTGSDPRGTAASEAQTCRLEQLDSPPRALGHESATEPVPRLPMRGLSKAASGPSFAQGLTEGGLERLPRGIRGLASRAWAEPQSSQEGLESLGSRRVASPGASVPRAPQLFLESERVDPSRAP